MARRPVRRKTNRRSRRVKRNRAPRQSGSNIPRIVSVPNDPRPVPLTSRQSVVIPIDLSYDPNSSVTKYLSYGDIFDNAVINISKYKAHPSPLLLKIEDILTIACNKAGISGSEQNANRVDITLHKVQFWGPHSSTVQGASVGMAINLGGGTSTLVASDAGTATSRPRVGFSLPKGIWFHGATSANIIEIWFDRKDEPIVTWPSSVSAVGELRISCTLNRTDTQLSSHLGA